MPNPLSLLQSIAKSLFDAGLDYLTNPLQPAPIHRAANAAVKVLPKRAIIPSYNFTMISTYFKKS